MNKKTKIKIINNNQINNNNQIKHQIINNKMIIKIMNRMINNNPQKIKI